MMLTHSAEQMRMDIPKDLGQRIVEATRLAISLHMQHSLHSEFIPGGTGSTIGRAGLSIGGADFHGGAAKDGGDFTPMPASSRSSRQGNFAAGGAAAAESEAA
jgi:hypothetical protein